MPGESQSSTFSEVDGRLFLVAVTCTRKKFCKIKTVAILLGNRQCYQKGAYRMNTSESVAHTAWICKYHIVWIPKYCKKRLFGVLREEIGPVIRELARQKESRILEGNMMSDHVHMLITIPPKYSVSSVIGFIKGKSAIYIARNFQGKKRNFVGESFWA